MLLRCQKHEVGDKYSWFVLIALFVSLSDSLVRADPGKKAPPNIVFILADDLGYGDLGCFGQKQIQTPNIDKLAGEGIRFRQCYAGCTVCAPSRCCLMTGFHTGHARVRGNALVPLLPEDVTIAEILKKAGYTTALCGKWGLGEAGSTGIPTKKGFDYFYGYLSQVHAHNYYPEFLWRGEAKDPLEGNVVVIGVATKKVVYAPDRITGEAIQFIERNKNHPFFLYYAPTLPHANNEAGKMGMEIPDDAPYKDRTWPQQQKNHAAMISRLDRDVGQLLTTLKKQKLDENTIVFFSSDNGPHKEGGADPEFFQSSGPLQGYKRSMTEGGIRVPMIVRWPGTIKPGESDRVWAFWDFMPTAAALAGVSVPAGIDGMDMTGAFLPGRQTLEHEFLYWEFHEGGSKQAVRMKNWKAIRTTLDKPLALYDLTKDIGEKNDVAGTNPEIVATIEKYLKTARTDSPYWPLNFARKKSKK